jgi:hypothetical protein
MLRLVRDPRTPAILFPQAQERILRMILKKLTQAGNHSEVGEHPL